jgi:competence protein ComK
MISYEINSNTMALISLKNNQTKIIEKDNIYIINKNTMDIIKDSCEYFGSSYLGRKEGTKRLTGITHKSPIIIEETNKIIYFPTESPRLSSCCWISFNNIKKYINNNGKATIIFDNDRILNLDISYGILDNQILRSSKLESILQKRLNTAF